MGVKDSNYQVVYRGQELPRFINGGWVFFQRLKEYGGGYWIGQTYEDAFIFGIERPVSLNEGMAFLVVKKAAEVRYLESLTAEDDPNLSLF